MANRFLNNITINDEYTLPSADGTNGQAIVTDGAGNLSFGTVAAGTADAAIKITLTVKNVSGGTLNAGTLVRVAPTANPPSGNVLEVDIADNSSASTMPAVGILIEQIANEAEGDCVAFGRAAGFSTSGYTEGDPIWVGSNGAFVGTKPTGTALIQKVGQIIKVHSSNGSIEVFGAGRTNDVPNIPQDQLWLGNSSGVATATSHTVENISNVTTSTKTDGQALVWDETNNYWKNGDVAAAGGGGGAELSIERDVITATANQQAFTISSDITASSNTQVYIDGVYQAKSNYTTSGAVITFSTGVPAGAEVEVVHFISVLSKVYTDTFTGDGSDVTFDASKDVSDENVTQVYIDGVYQSKDNYTTSGTTITFSTAPPSGSAIEVVHFTPATYSTLNSNQFTGTGSQTDFTLTQAVDVDTSFVFVQGVYQEKDTYSISGTTLTFTTAPISGYSIEVITVGAVANVTSSPVNSVNGLTGDVTISGGTDWQATPKTANFTAVAGEGYFVNTTSTAITVTLPSSPTAGDEVSIVDYAGTADTNNITITSSDNINGSFNDVKINFERGGVSVVYVDATQGWIAYNAANETATALASAVVPLTVDYLVVAGGGGGNSGGGGAGGLRTSYTNSSSLNGHSESSLSLSVATNYTVSVGPGGLGTNNANRLNTTSGVNSVFSNITSTGGGRSGLTDAASPLQNGADGGSGGGGAGDGRGSTGGSAVTSPVTQGYSGGNSTSSAPYPGSGGGGASASGSNGSGGAGGNGGNGLAVNIINTTNATTSSVGEVSGSDVYFAGGGGGGVVFTTGPTSGGTGGSGGGGNGSITGNGENGDPNTGGGGGGYYNYTTSNTGGSGGSGVVILRYPSGYNISETTSPNVLTFNTYTEGSDKVTVFTSGENGTIQFS
jgi:hypothetical protein